jgi:hypothetical protein
MNWALVFRADMLSGKGYAPGEYFHSPKPCPQNKTQRPPKSTSKIIILNQNIYISFSSATNSPWGLHPGPPPECTQNLARMINSENRKHRFQHLMSGVSTNCWPLETCVTRQRHSSTPLPRCVRLAKALHSREKDLGVLHYTCRVKPEYL